MTRTDLHVIPGGAKPETVAQHVARLQREARQLAGQHVAELIADTAALAERWAEVSTGGEAFHPGIREAAGRLSDDLVARAATFNAINSRSQS
jgi:hypothetical protein